MPNENNDDRYTSSIHRSHSDCVVAVELALPTGFDSLSSSVERLEASLKELPGVVTAQLHLVRRVLRVELICGVVSPGALVSALYQALRLPQ